jgi:hypothetical protein
MPRNPDRQLLAALAAAETAALAHVRWLRRNGVTLSEAAAAIGLDPLTSWDEVTQAYALRQRDMFNQWDHQQDSGGTAA